MVNVSGMLEKLTLTWLLQGDRRRSKMLFNVENVRVTEYPKLEGIILYVLYKVIA